MGLPGDGARHREELVALRPLRRGVARHPQMARLRRRTRTRARTRARAGTALRLWRLLRGAMRRVDGHGRGAAGGRDLDGEVDLAGGRRRRRGRRGRRRRRRLVRSASGLWLWLSWGCWEGAVLFCRACFECSVLFCSFVVGFDLIGIPVLIDMLVRSFARSLFHVFFFFRTY